MDIKIFSLQKLEKEREDFIENKEINKLKHELLNKKHEVQKAINDYKYKKEQLDIIIKDTKAMENDNTYLLEELKRKDESLYEDSEAGFKELESIKENIEELKVSYQKKEEELLELIVLTEELEKEINSKKENINISKKKFNDEFKEFKEKEKNNLLKVKEIEGTIEELIKEIPSEDYKKYKRIQERYPFTGIAIIEDGNKCSYCRLNVSVVTLRKVEQKEITYCESCSRLLIGKREEIK